MMELFDLVFLRTAHLAEQAAAFVLPVSTQPYYLYVSLLNVAVVLGIAMMCMVAVDRWMHVLLYGACKLWYCITKSSPEGRYKFTPFPSYEAQDGARGLNPASLSSYPMCAVQLPMFNERAVCQDAIECASKLQWPPHKLLIQVLDDSTDEFTRSLVDEKAAEWIGRGVNIQVLRRSNRTGYKAGAMKNAMENLPATVEHVAIFDADFRPEPNFLIATVPYLVHNPRVGFVQARWVFQNANESLLTKVQEIALNFHTKCEQWIHFTTGTFFNFNGTAGVWRRSCIDDVGGWMARTTVEDMDLSLRAYIYGWKAVYLENHTCLNELPASLFAYRKQQHRWTCGPVALWHRMSAAIWGSELKMYQKLALQLSFFSIRKTMTHVVTFCFFGVVVPLTVITPEVSVPTWALFFVPFTVGATTIMYTLTWSSFVYLPIFVLFENAMGIVRIWAVIAGFFGLQNANEWVVTTKLGSKRDKASAASSIIPISKMYSGEAVMAVYLAVCGLHGMTHVSTTLPMFIMLQGAVFLAFATNMVDCNGALGSGFPGNTWSKMLNTSKRGRDCLPTHTKTPRHLVKDQEFSLVLAPQKGGSGWGTCKQTSLHCYEEQLNPQDFQYRYITTTA